MNIEKFVSVWKRGYHQNKGFGFISIVRMDRLAISICPRCINPKFFLLNLENAFKGVLCIVTVVSHSAAIK